MAGLFFDTMTRIHEGPRVKEKDFDLAISRRSKELAEKYDIKYEPAQVVPSDDAMADRLVEAALEFATETGQWCLNTQKVVRFSKSEIMEFHCNYHTPKVLGYAKDQVLLQARKPESTTRPLVLSGGGASEVSEELYVKHMMNFAMEPTADVISNCNPHSIEGMEIRAGSPMETHGIIQEVAWIREAMRRVGRPGMPMLTGPGCSATAAAGIAAINEERGLRRNDFIFATMLTEMKMEYDGLARAVVFIENGLNVVALYAPMVGGWAGGPATTAIVGTATCLLAGPSYGATIVVHHPVHMNLKSGATTRPETLWIQSISGQAIARNTVFPMAQNCFFDARPGTKQCLYEAAANALVAVSSGQHTGPGPSGIVGGEDVDFITGLEQRMMGEVTRAATGMSRTQANELVLKCLEKYLPTSGKQPNGKPMPELYDVHLNRPKPEWLQMFVDAKDEIRRWGVPFLY